MAPNRNKSRSTVRPGGSRVRDARDLLPRKNNSRLNSGVTTKRILKTSQGLVTNKKKKGISTAQLRNRQNQQGGSANLNAFKQRNQRAPQPTRVGVKAAMKRSTMINSNPVLQHAILDIAGALTAERRNIANARRQPRATSFVGNPVQNQRNLATSIAQRLVERPIPAHLQSRLDRKQEPPCSVLVSNLHANVSEADLNELYRSIGPISTAMFVSPGNALVTYHSKNNAIKAVETYHLRLLDGQPMTCVLLTPDMVPDKQQPSVPER